MTIQQILLGIGAAAPTLEYFLVAGGGGAGNTPSGGGGGGGGVLSAMAGVNGGGGQAPSQAPLLLTGVTYTVVIGSGGSAGTNGGDTYISTSSGEIARAFGGGYGTGYATGASGGCGGGGGGTIVVAGGTGSQGYNGGSSNAGTQPGSWQWYCPLRQPPAYDPNSWPECQMINAGGGGGGAGSAGGNAVDSGNVPGAGGNGIATTFLGTSTTFAAGGAGTNKDRNATSSNGSGWGGYGSGGNALNSTSGTSGVAYIRVPSSLPVGTTSAPSSVVGAHRIYTFTSTTTITW